MLANAKDLYADVEAHANTTIKKEEDLIVCSLAISEQERAVVEKEWDIQVHSEAVDARLEHELKGVTSHEASLDTREAALVEERKNLEETRLIVCNCELTTDIRHARLDTREAGLVDRERWLAEV
jgi:hypothetical protein